jgi:Uma2 family endonuclease
MTQAHTKNFTFAEYLAYDTGTDSHRELVKGEVVVMPVASRLHGEMIQLFLLVARVYHQTEFQGQDILKSNTLVKYIS